ncbi:MAG: beta-eliminating lyase-related protein [Bacteroidales bacterium]|nr:beta-eliminating lyase-related protein [Bacteroidales bacterium]
MIHFDSDYMAGALPEIMQRLIDTNLEETSGYGTDEYTRRAKELIKSACGNDNSQVYFLVGGTQTNKTVIDTLLERYEGVVAADTGHINVHESGAIENSGHKVIALPSYEGKVKAEDVDSYLTSFFADETYAHMNIPGALYISFPTEYGTLYSKEELSAISKVCRKWDKALYVDGARLGYGLVAEGNDVTLKDLSTLTDVFYIGGTKQGALFGEAVVVNSESKRFANFTTIIKMHGALLAKGRLLGVQFETLFADGLYTRAAKNAVELAMKLQSGFIDKGYQPAIASPTNQQFFKLPNEVIDRLSKIATFEYWGPRGENESMVRFVCSWATTAGAVEKLLAAL